MKDIKYLAHRIEEELEDAEGYALEALKHKESNHALAQTLYDISKQELGHTEMLHAQAVKLIKEYRETGAPVPASMQAVWDWEHEKMIEHTNRIKILYDMFRS